MSDAVKLLQEAFDHVNSKVEEGNYPYLYGYLHASVEGFLMTHEREEARNG